MASRTLSLALLAFGLATGLLGSVSAQAPQQQQPTFRAGVKLVRVDVTATGRNDAPVPDLTASDFEVTEDGIPQRIEQLQFVKLDGERPAGDERSLQIRNQDQAEAEAARDDVRVFAIFLDDYHIDKSPGITIPLRKALSTLVGRFWPTDLVAIMDPLTPLSALEFTRSHAALQDVVNRFEGRQGEIFPIRSPVEEAQVGRGDLGRLRAEVTLSALASLVMRLGGLREGRKVVIFVSQGPPVFFGPDGNLQDLMRDVAEAASRGNVSIYPVDPRGLGVAARGSRETLYQLAGDSGGRVITNTNNPMIGLARVLQDTSAYYVLGYQPTRVEDDGKYHKISVKVKRPGVHVLAREGYWAPSGKELEVAREAAGRTLEPGIASALGPLGGPENTRRAANVWVGMSREEDGGTRVSVSWDEAETASGRAPVAALEVEVLDAGNGTVIQPARKIPGGGTADAAKRASASFVLQPGPAALRVTARSSADSVIDRWVLPVVVPRFGAESLSLSTARLYRAQSLAQLRAINAAPDAVPGATRRFARSDRVVVALECYAPAGTQPDVQAHLVMKDGRELAPLPLPSPEHGSIRFELPVGSLGQGTYILRIRARVGPLVSEQHVAFAVAR